MNNNKYIICKDIDRQIISHLSFPQILTMSAVNQTYRKMLRSTCQDIQEIKYNFCNACDYGNLKMAQDLWNMNRAYNLDHAFYLCVKNNFIDVAKWLIDITEKSGTKIIIHYKSHNNLFVIACKNNNIQTAKLLVQLYDNGYDRWGEEFFSLYDACNVSSSLEVIKWLFELEEKGYHKIGVHDYDEEIFRNLCCNSDVNAVKWFVEMCEKSSKGRINIHISDEEAFYNACKSGKIEIAKFLIELGENTYGKIDIHTTNEYPFRIACAKGYFEMAKWLIELGEGLYDRINIHAHDEFSFIEACHNSQLAIVQWLIELGEESYGIINIHDQSEEAFVGALANTDMTNLLINLSKRYHSRIIINERIRKSNIYRAMSEEKRLCLIQKLNE